MKTDDFDYNLPSELIATHPSNPRDHSRLLILDKNTGDILHKNFFDIIDYLEEGDLLILNNSCVIPARLLGKKKDTGGKVEVFLHKNLEDGIWECLLGGRGISVGLKIKFGDDDKLTGMVTKNNEDGTWIVEFSLFGEDLLSYIEQVGHIPLPPYIEKRRQQIESMDHHDKTDYQTIYADQRKKGSVAAPTAGLHFTPELISKIKKKGIKIKYITLHVGMGTFAPVKVDDVNNHKMHAEWAEIDREVIEEIAETKKQGRKIITVGTTSTRALEAAWRDVNVNKISKYANWVDIFIYPGYEFKVVDAMITNFHLPKSTLLMLVSALASKSSIDKVYQEAILNRYRFYSYGDAMFIF